MNFQKAHKISVIHTLLQSDECLLYFIFSHKKPELRAEPQALIQESKLLSIDDQLAIKICLDIWCYQGTTTLSELLQYLSYEKWIYFLQAMKLLHEIGDDT